MHYTPHLILDLAHTCHDKWCTCRRNHWTGLVERGRTLWMQHWPFKSAERPLSLWEITHNKRHLMCFMRILLYIIMLSIWLEIPSSLPERQICLSKELTLKGMRVLEKNSENAFSPRKSNGTLIKYSSRAFQWMVMSVCFDNRKFWGQFLCPALGDWIHAPSHDCTANLY
jgi:hypothetical protein